MSGPTDSLTHLWRWGELITYAQQISSAVLLVTSQRGLVENFDCYNSCKQYTVYSRWITLWENIVKSYINKSNIICSSISLQMFGVSWYQQITWLPQKSAAVVKKKKKITVGGVDGWRNMLNRSDLLFNFYNCLSLPILSMIIALVKHKISQITDIFWGVRGWKQFNVSFPLPNWSSRQYIVCNVTTKADLAVSIIVPY